jgi:hypothetical protein
MSLTETTPASRRFSALFATIKIGTSLRGWDLRCAGTTMSPVVLVAPSVPAGAELVTGWSEAAACAPEHSPLAEVPGMAANNSDLSLLTPSFSS